MESFPKKQLPNKVRFFIVNFPMRPELVFLSPLVYQKDKFDSVFALKCNFELIFL